MSDEEPIIPHDHLEYNRQLAAKVFMQTKATLENVVPNQVEPVIQPIKMKLNEYDVTVSIEAFDKPMGNYAYPIPYSQPHDYFKLELKNVLIATWNLYHARFKRFYEV